MENKGNRNFNIKVIVFTAILFNVTLSVFNFLPDFARLVGFVIGILVVIAGLLLYSTERHRLVFIFMAGYIFFSFLAFPFIYLCLIYNDRNSFYVENTLVSYIQANALNSIQNSYDINKGEIELRYLNNSLKSADPKLTKKLKDNYFEYNIAQIDTVSYQVKLLMTEPAYDQLYVYNNDGDEIFIIGDEYHNLSFGKKYATIKDCLVDYRNLILYQVEDYDKRLNAVKNHDVWNYFTVLPYCLNIYTNSLKPQTLTANIVVYIQWLIITGALIPIIFGLGLETVKNKI